MSLKQASFLVVAVGIVICIASGVLGVLKHNKIAAWPHLQAKAFGAAPVSQKASDAYGIRVGIEYDYNGKKSRTIEPDTFSGAFHKVAARVDEMNRSKTVSIIINPDKPDEILFNEGFSIDMYLLPFILACVGGFVLFVAFILLMGVYTKLMYYFFLVVGIISLAVTVPVLVRSIHRYNWPTVAAQIEDADYVSKVDTKDHWTYAPRAWLYYEVGTEPYRSVYVGYYSGGTNIVNRMKERIREWKAKGKMDVRYNPKNPYEISTGPGFLFALIPFGVGLLFVGCALLIRKLVLKL